MKSKTKPKTKEKPLAKKKRPEKEIGLFSFKTSDADEAFVFRLDLKPVKLKRR